MSHPFSHPKGRDLLKRVAQPFRESNVFVARDSSIIFVCGGAIGGQYMRPKFVEYARENLDHLRVFLAEDAQSDLITHHDPEFNNVAVFEELIAEISECIVLFPESPGSYSELGYFARSPDVCRKLLVVNDATLQGQDSFMALGPIDTIDNRSIFRPTIQIEYGENPNFELIRQRLTQRIAARRRQRFQGTEHSNLSAVEKFYFLFEIVAIFQLLDIEGVIYAYRSVFRHAGPREIRQLLSILVAARYVVRHPTHVDYFYVTDSAKSFLDIETIDRNELRLEITDFYQAEYSDLYDLVREIPR